MRRVDCRCCGVVTVEEVPWGDGKRTLTKAYMLFLAGWARRLSWKETAEAFGRSWDKVFDAVEHVVTWGQQCLNCLSQLSGQPQARARTRLHCSQCRDGRLMAEIGGLELGAVNATGEPRNCRSPSLGSEFMTSGIRPQAG
jgi:hypothetical protein